MPKAGVYKITNTKSGDFYIGSSKDVMNRWRQHKNIAKKGNGFYIHSAMKKHGLENFVLEILEEHDDKTVRLIREQHYIDVLNPSYNLKKQVCDKPGGRAWSAERKQAYSVRRKAEVALGINVPPVPSDKHFRHSEPGKQKIRQAVRKARARVAHERDSYLTPEGLASKRAKQETWLTPERRQRFVADTQPAREKAWAAWAAKTQDFAERFAPLIEAMQQDGLNFIEIAEQLNAQGYTARRGRWTDQNVCDLLKRLGKSPNRPRGQPAEQVRKKNSDAFAEKMFAVIEEMRQSGMNMSEIARKLNQAGHPSRRGEKWTYANVRQVLKRVGEALEPRAVAAQKARQKAADAHAVRFAPLIRDLQQHGMNQYQIAAQLNADGYVTRLGSQWTEQTVHRLLKRVPPTRMPASSPHYIGWHRSI